MELPLTQFRDFDVGETNFLVQSNFENHDARFIICNGVLVQGWRESGMNIDGGGGKHDD